MAKIRYGSVVSDVRGSVGGVTFRGAGGGGVLSARAGGKKVRTAAQLRQNNLVAESRRVWKAMTDGERKAFGFVYTQKFRFRPAVGQSWGTVLGAFTSWYVGLRMCGVVPSSPTTPLEQWSYDGNGQTFLFAPGFSLLDGFYALGSDVTHTPLCIWAVNAGVGGMPPARPVWSLIYCGLTDQPASVVNVPDYGMSYDLTPFLVSRGLGRFDSGNTIFRVYRANSTLALVNATQTVLPTG